MGDDRRGGHVWKFVSDAVVKDPHDPANSRLLDKGTLYVARFEPGYGGRWIPLRPDTPLRRPEPEECFTQHVQVPSRFVGGPISVGDPERDNPDISVDDWIAIVESYVLETQGKAKKFADCTLGDLVAGDHKQGVVLMDAFLMANACGGTPSARPEDLEVHPFDKTIYIAFTENAGSSDGSPDRRIFKDSDATSSRQYGALYRLLEGGVEGRSPTPPATTFKWGQFLGSGEVAEKGNGFGFADNLVFDPQGHLWMVTDITTTAQNTPTRREREDGTYPGGLNFPGIFGNNAMFVIPTHGDNAGQPFLFATGPMDCEFCGPTFSEDGLTLILSVQHPGELDGMAHPGKAARGKGAPAARPRRQHLQAETPSADRQQLPPRPERPRPPPRRGLHPPPDLSRARAGSALLGLAALRQEAFRLLTRECVEFPPLKELDQAFVRQKAQVARDNMKRATWIGQQMELGGIRLE